MTILAWDGKDLAVDSRVTMGGTVIGDNFDKMFQFQHPQFGPMVGAVTGVCELIGPWLETLMEKGFAPVQIPGMDDDYSLSGIFVTEDGENAFVASTNGGYFHIGKMPHALGSGIPTAQYLLSKGKSALYTVREVCSSNLFCGGEIKVFNTKKGKITIYDS